MSFLSYVPFQADVEAHSFSPSLPLNGSPVELEEVVPLDMEKRSCIWYDMSSGCSLTALTRTWVFGAALPFSDYIILDSSFVNFCYR